MMEALAAPQGYLDGRFLALSFNLLRGKDLIWSTVVKNYLLGEEYPAFDLLHWNGDVTNLPATLAPRISVRPLSRQQAGESQTKWLALDTPIDLSKVKTPTYIQAGREDHIAPCRKRLENAGPFHRADQVRARWQRPYRWRGQPAGAEEISILDQRRRSQRR